MKKPVIVLSAPRWRIAAALGCCLASLSIGTSAATLPPDVRNNHWAAHAVEEALANGVLSTQPDGQFHGEARVTHGQAVIALAKLAQSVEQRQWHAAKSRAVPTSAVAVLEKGDWRQRPVTRYMLASLLARFGDYLNNGLTRAPAGSKDTGKSEALPAKAVVKIATTHPAYASLSYLAEGRMVWPDSPLLKADSLPINGAELSRALTEMVTGLNDRVTELGLDANGNTPDPSFHTRDTKATKKP